MPIDMGKMITSLNGIVWTPDKSCLSTILTESWILTYFEE